MQMRQKGAVISSKFRIRSQLQNYIWQLNNISLFPLLSHRLCGNIHFSCSKSEYRYAITH
ncbi:hypothetical protein R533_03815 [Salmonella enterica subsp. houtenae serovar 40:z4,z32:-]|nr:hypothetical protein [Salmonella enterica]OSD46255.1 hypothetical protein R533_03815 [Salmonella enterica subsp. houtenae serovar 40:z4,z32:-]OSD80390.1 hypothetical protein R529_01675 [Salmonella enterica subsp. houtenae serovar 40:z4,z32:-]OSD93068.1 hypothetical protein R526_01675 [Salmonella enterica subsp. houtenae serovar 40:z4,z32:-]OSE33369.1 hypothetical protein R517_06405 [Salmonella enterica subsp. houtenae serovar 40:z4,z32:-]